MSRCDLREGLAEVVGVRERGPPVSDASVCNVSCCAASWANCWATPARRTRSRLVALRLRGVAAGHHRLQAPRVDRIDRHVRAHGGVDRLAQLDLVVGAASLHARAEIENRLLLLNRAERVRQRAQTRAAARRC